MSSDVHGKSRMARNILTGWGVQFVQMASGFVVPRLIDNHIGQDALGVWDFAWSIVVYFNLIQMGVTGSINRYVAFHRSREDYAGINQAVSSVAMIMRGMGATVFLLASILAVGAGYFFSHRLGAQISDARWVIFLLGTSMAVEVGATVYSSVLTGCHRWDWHNGIQAATNVLSFVGMVAVLLLGYGLVGLAIVNLAAETVGRSARVLAAYRTCPWLEIRRRHFRRKTAAEMLSFGGKTFLTYTSQLVTNSTVSIMIVAYLGPAALALYSRPLALVRNLSTFVNKYAMVFSPTISSLQGAGRHDEVRSLILKATRYGLFLSLPVTLFLIVYGGEVLRVWMGDRYVDPWLIGVLVAGLFAQIAGIPLFKALTGLNLHGKVGIMNLVTAGVAVLGAWMALGIFHGGLMGLAIAVGVPLTVVNGICIPWYACRHLRVTAGEFWREGWRTPVLCSILFLICLLAGRVVFRTSPMLAAFCGSACGGLALAICYWKVALPQRWKARLGRWIPVPRTGS